jgi:hypothetical protein
MKPIKGLIELEEPSDNHFASLRAESLRTFRRGLGPPDLVSVRKSAGKQTSRSVHVLCGLQISGPDSLIQYFKSLERSRPTKAFRGFAYSVSGGDYSCFNSFTGTDVQFSAVSDSHGSFSVQLENSAAPVSDAVLWQQLRIASVLRFWAAPTPLFRAIQNLPHAHCDALRMLPVAVLTKDDFVYLISNHPPSRELDIAVSYLLIGSAGGDFSERLGMAVGQLPRVLPLVWKILPAHLGFMTPCAETVYRLFPDDTQVAYIFVSCCLEDGDFDRAQPAVPLLTNTMWCCPYSCLAMARLCAFKNEFDDAFACLNAACYARQYQVDAAQRLVQTESGVLHSKSSASPRPGIIEEEAVASQLSGLGYLLYRGVSELARKITPGRFKIMVSQRFRTMEDVDKLLNGGSVAPADGAPPDRELDLLYDPGVFALQGFAIPQYVRDLPLCRRFAAVADSVVDDIGKGEAAVTSRQLDGFAETRKCELLALKLEDNPLLEFVGGHVKKHKQLKAFHELLQLRFNQPRMWQKLVKGGELLAKKMTMNEYNAFLLFRALADGMAEFLPS